MLTMTLGLCQPLNAFIRPHKTESKVQPFKRRLWELVHKGSGWLAIGMSVAAIGMGISVLADQVPGFPPPKHYNDLDF